MEQQKRIFIINETRSREWKIVLETKDIEPIKVKEMTEEEIWRQDARLASKDKEREKELKFWDKMTSKIDDE